MSKVPSSIKSINQIIKLKDPTNKILEKWKRPNGLIIKKVSVPIGVISVIYESRPNVTSDVASLCFKSGNAVILKGGSEAFYTNRIISNLFRISLKKNGIDQNYVQFIESKNRKIVDKLLSKMKGHIDLKSAISDCEQVNDYVSRDLLEEILESEEEHVDHLETQLALLEKVGKLNFLQSQVKV